MLRLCYPACLCVTLGQRPGPTLIIFSNKRSLSRASLRNFVMLSGIKVLDFFAETTPMSALSLAALKGPQRRRFELPLFKICQKNDLMFFSFFPCVNVTYVLICQVEATIAYPVRLLIHQRACQQHLQKLSFSAGGLKGKPCPLRCWLEIL